MDKEEIQSVLRGFVGMLSLIEVADLEKYVSDVSRNNSVYDAVGPLVDPTEYRQTLTSGRRDQVRVQLEIAKHCLEIRKLFEQLPVASE